MNSKKIHYSILSATWQASEADIGNSIEMTAHVKIRALRNRSNPNERIADTLNLDFNVYEYSGVPPQFGGGSRKVLLETISTNTKISIKAGTTETQLISTHWIVKASEETSPYGGLPEFCFTAGIHGIGPQSKLLKVGWITDICWQKIRNNVKPLNNKSATFWFKNNQPVKLRVECHRLNGFLVDFEIFNDPDNKNDNNVVARIRNIPVKNGIAETRWRMTTKLLKKYSFGNFKFDIIVQHNNYSTRYKPLKFRSKNIRHTATINLFFALYYIVSDKAFFKAAQTQAEHYNKKSNDARSISVIKGIRSETNFKKEWTELKKIIRKYPRGSRIIEGHVLTHASKGSRNDGLEFDPGTFDRNEIRSAIRLPWASNGVLVLHGCNTAVDVLRNWSPAKEFAKRQRIRVLGQDGFAYFSSNDSKYRRIPNMKNHNGPVYLWAYRRKRNDWLGNNEKIPAKIYR